MTSSTERPQAVLPWVISLILVASAAVNPLDFITGASEYDRAANATAVHTLVKLGIAGLAGLIGAYGLLFSTQTRRLFNSIPGVGLVALGFVFFVAGMFAPPSNQTISIASSLIYFCYLLFLATALTTNGVRSVLGCLLAGNMLYLVDTWGQFLFFPDRGTFTEYVSVDETVVRMGGTGHPNTIAKVAVGAGLIGLAFLTGRLPRGKVFDSSENSRDVWPSRDEQRAFPNDLVLPNDAVLAVGTSGPWWRLILIGVVILSVATVLATISRTAILAGTAAAAMIFFNRLYGRAGIAISVLALSLITALVLAGSLWSGEGPIPESAVGAVTKSGDVTELTSLTGRTVIWDEAIGLIAERPLTGWGLDSAASVMSREATGTHSLLLHVSFSSGVFGATLILGLMLWSLMSALTSPYEWIRGIMVFVLISGLVEDTLFESFPTLITLVWIVALLAPVLVSASSITIRRLPQGRPSVMSADSVGERPGGAA